MSTTGLLLWIWTIVVAGTRTQACAIGDVDLGLCAPLESPQFSDIDCSVGGFQIKCVARCITGFKFKDMEVGQELELDCNSNEGSWSENSLPICVVATCEAAEPPHGSIDCDDVGDSTRICSIACEPDYRHSSSHLFMCNMKTGEWSPSFTEFNRFPACIAGEERCKNMRSPVDGSVACNVTDGEQRCYPNCPPGYSFSSSIPHSGFFTCSDGNWLPSDTIPDCAEDADFENKIGDGHFTGIYTNIKGSADLSGVCYTWGQHHYRTFDGVIFRHRGACQYLLARDYPGNQFEVHVKNDPGCDGSAMGCTREVIIIYSEEELRLKRDENDQPAAYMDGNKLMLPESAYGLSVEQTADYIIVKVR